MDRFGTERVIATGFAAFVAGYALFLVNADASPAYASAILPTMILIGIGFVLTFPSLNMQATMGVGDHEQGLASGLVQTSFQVGGAIAVAVVTAVQSSGADGDFLDALRPAVGVVTGIALLGLVIALSGVLGPRRREVLAAEG